MAAENLERIYKLTVDGGEAVRQLQALNSATQNIDKRFEALATGLRRTRDAVAGFKIGDAIGAGIRESLAAFDELAKESQKIGVTVEELQRLNHVADLSGISHEQLKKAVVTLSDDMGDLAKQSTLAGRALSKMGVKDGDQATQALAKVADQFEKMPDGLKKTALAAELFGKKLGPEMVPLLNQGGQAIRDMAKEAENFGMVSTETARQAEAFLDEMTRFGKVFDGAKAQVTAGLLPALTGLVNTFKDAQQTGSGFKEVGEGIGDALVFVTDIGIRVSAVLQAVGKTLAAVAAIFSADANQDVGTIVSSWIDDLNELDRVANERLKSLRTNVEAAQKGFMGPPAPETKKTNDFADALRKEADAAKDANKWIKELEKTLKAQAEAQKISDDLVTSTTEAWAKQNQSAIDFIRRRQELAKATEDNLDNIEKEGADLQFLIDTVTKGTEAYEEATTAQRLYAQAKLDSIAAGEQSTKTIEKERDALDVLTEEAEGFFENLGRGAADAEDLFKRMIQSMIAQLLKLAAQKFIIDAIFGKKALGAAYDGRGHEVSRFATGAVFGTQTVLPMAMLAERAPEAIMPLRRGPDGSLGVEAVAQAMNVNITNKADVSVRAERRSAREVEIIIEQTRSAIAQDLRHGGTVVSRAFESAYGIGRGSAASF